MKRARTYISIAVTVAAAVVLAITSSAYAAAVIENFGNQTYSPGTQSGSHYDNCQYWQKAISETTFYKNANRLGKAILINTSGGWLATNEDTSAATTLYTPGAYLLQPKKGSVKNTSSYTYSGGGYIFGDNFYCA